MIYPAAPGDEPALLAAGRDARRRRTGLPTGFQGAVPAFSPDGAHVSFNFWAGTFAADGGRAHGRPEVARDDRLRRNQHVLEPPRPLHADAAGTAVAYSSFFPNSGGDRLRGRAVEPLGDWGYTWHRGNTGELWWVDVASGTAHRLDELNGYARRGNLPAEPSSDGGAPLTRRRRT